MLLNEPVKLLHFNNMIYKAFVKSPIGFWIISVENDELCSIQYQKEQPSFEQGENVILHSACRQMEEYFEGKRKQFKLPLYLEPYTTFQKAVWKNISTIPFGKTISYTDLAISLNNLKAIRAVGLTNGKNPFPIVIPCHRVIGKDGSLTGYAYGLPVKKWLLEHEGVLAVQTSFF